MKFIEFMETGTAAVIVALLMCIIGAIFVILYYADSKSRKTVAEVTEEYERKLAEKDKVIEFLKREKLEIGAKRFELHMENKLLTVKLANANHKAEQFAKAQEDRNV